MIQDFFIPVSDELVSKTEFGKTSLGNSIIKYSHQNGFPDLTEVNLAIFDVREGRGALGNEETGIGADEIRKELYKLQLGNWKISITDLGSVLGGDIIEDTYYALREIISFLVKKNILPIIIGGGIDLVYANYRAYDQLDQMVNISVASSRLSFGNIDEKLNSKSYLSKIIIEEPSNLFNFSNIGYQTYYNSQEEIALIDALKFESYRVGVLRDISIVEPVMRDADIVAIDLGVLRASEAPGNGNSSPNGLYGDDTCAIARYAGISDKVSSFGVYEFNKIYDVNNTTSKMVSQIIWYFIEGYSLRANDYPFGSKDNYLKYMVPFDGNLIHFHQSDKSLRWWMEVEIPTQNKYSRHVLVPCSYDDYLNAIEQKLPERWFNANDKLT